ncbi:MAG TPA: response regulator [bacterium]|nr:response regulator [bacterium]
MEKKKILIADDEESTRNLMDFVLSKEGFEIFQAPNGKTALKLALELRPDLLILDIVMPDMNGYTLFQEIKKLPSLKNTPMIFSSGKQGMKEFIDLEDGPKPEAFLTKPFRIQELVETVKKIFHQG